MLTQHRLLIVIALSAGLNLAALSCAAVEADTGAVGATPESAMPNAGEPGSWQEHKYTFNFMGFTTTYSCDGLEDKLRLLLKLNGAGPKSQVSASCTRGYGRPDKLAMAYLTFSSLQPAQVPGAAPAGAPAAASGSSPGTWRHVELSPRHPFQLDLGDCELIEQFRDRVLPLFTTRNISNDVTCVPHQDSGSNFHLSYDVFAPPAAPRQ